MVMEQTPIIARQVAMERMPAIVTGDKHLDTEPASMMMERQPSNQRERHLSNQEDLVHSLDPDPVFDYLLQHGVLDQSTIDEICGEEELVERNIRLLKHLEDSGNLAVELFINALRQSGQMHLASSLDIEHRIKPVYGQGYWEKQRYKGQVTISFQLVAAKVTVPKDSVDDRSPRAQDINKILTPFKFKHSYENMLLLTENDEGPKARKILEYSYEEENGKKSSWCCCFPFFCCGSKPNKRKAKEKHREENVVDSKNVQQNGADVSRSEISLNYCDIMVSLPSQPSSPIKSGSTFFKSRPPSPKLSESQSFSQESFDRNSNPQLSDILSSDVSDLPDIDQTNSEVKYDPKTENVSVEVSKSAEKFKKSKKNSKKKTKTTDPNVKANNQKNDSEGSKTVENKENSDPCIYDVDTGAEKDKDLIKRNGHSVKEALLKDKKKKATPPTSLGDKPIKGMTRSETYELVERWKSEGQKYDRARDQFFQYCDNAIQSKIVRYFEQKRSTLVLQIGVDKGLSVCTICMTTKQVRKLLEDYEMGQLHEDIVQCILPQNIVDKMDCCAIHLRTVIDMDDFTMSVQELS